jgi:hypothetical protein
MLKDNWSDSFISEFYMLIRGVNHARFQIRAYLPGKSA